MLLGTGIKFAAALQWKLSRKSPGRWGERIQHSLDTAGLLQTNEDEIIVHVEETKAKMIAIMHEVGAFKELATSAPDLVDALEIEGEELPEGPVNGSGKKKKAKVKK
jgi:hypothetical protein